VLSGISGRPLILATHFVVKVLASTTGFGLNRFWPQNAGHA